jgi:hypothetical protein
MFIFRSISGKWELVGIEGLGWVDDCDVSGDTIIAFTDSREFINHYQFDRDNNVAVPIEGDFRRGESFNTKTKRSLDGNHIVISVSETYIEHYDRVFIYKRSDGDQQFRFHQSLKVSDYEEGFGRTFDVQGDTLVVGGNNRTFIFLDHGDFFEESIILDKAYTSIKLSNRNVIATTEANRVESFVILEDCTQLVPTQTPSLSTSPSFTQSPSSVPSAVVSYGFTHMVWLVDDGNGKYVGKDVTNYPTESPTTSTSSPITSSRPSLSPSLSLPPTEKCFVINIAFIFDKYPEQTFWTLTKLGLYGNDDILIKSYRPLSTDVSYEEKMCLKEGKYRINVKNWDGLCCDDGLGSYSITSYGALIVRGGKFDREETRTFNLPYDSNLSPSQSPSASSAPSIVPTKSLDPTKKPSLAPTKSPSQNPSETPSTSLVPSVVPTNSFEPTKKLSLAPSNSQVPSLSPSLSLFPTETCYWLKLMVTFDEYEEETTWELLLTSSSSSSAKEYIFVNSTEPLEGVYDGSLCLPEGQYQFTIYDSYGDGMCCKHGEGSYNLTSYGEVIVQGGAFGASEMTTFDIPHDPISVITESTTAAPVVVLDRAAPTTTYAPTPIFSPS